MISRNMHEAVLNSYRTELFCYLVAIRRGKKIYRKTDVENMVATRLTELILLGYSPDESIKVLDQVTKEMQVIFNAE